MVNYNLGTSENLPLIFLSLTKKVSIKGLKWNEIQGKKITWHKLLTCSICFTLSYQHKRIPFSIIIQFFSISASCSSFLARTTLLVLIHNFRTVLAVLVSISASFQVQILCPPTLPLYFSLPLSHHIFPSGPHNCLLSLPYPYLKLPSTYK